MYRVSRCYRVRVKSPLAVSFEQDKLSAKSATYSFYHDKRFGTSPEYIEIGSPKAEYLPFYGCSGHIEGTFNASREESYYTSDKDGKETRHTRWVPIGTFSMRHHFLDHEVVVYASHKYNQKHVDHIPTQKCLTAAHSPHKADLDQTEIHSFEMPIPAVKDACVTKTEGSMEEAAERITGYSGNISISWVERNVKFNYLQPLYVPAYRVPMEYDGDNYFAFVSGYDASVRGPYLINALLLSRAIGIGSIFVILLLSPSKLAAIPVAITAALASSFAGEYAARRYPKLASEWNNRSREKAKKKAEDDKDDTYKIDPFCPEFETSSFKYQNIGNEQHQRRQEEHDRRWGSTGTKRSQGFGASSSGSSKRRDPKGYYKLLDLQGDEPLTEVKSAYRKCVMKNHPDHTGDKSQSANDKMAEINEAYRVIRDPARRRAYDSS